MSNEETLQEYNERLEENNTSLANVLETINNLPEASGGSSIDVYSTEEVKTNKVWIDGRPIYRLVTETTVGSKDGTLFKFTGNENVNEYISVKVMETWGGMTRLPLPTYASSSDYSIAFGTDGGIMIKTTHSNRRKIIIVEYTKKTD